MRILIVCPCPLDPELGAAQIHLNLAEGIRRLGHQVRVWTPLPLPPGVHWSMGVAAMRKKLGAFLEGAERFDVVDCPPALIRARFVRQGATWVCRSVQPDVQYLWEELRRRRLTSIAALAKTVGVGAWSLGTAALIHRGWMVSKLVLCLGAGEKDWIGQRFPRLRHKLHSYEAALSDEDSATLAHVRRARRPRSPTEPVRYLWIGRWAGHKGVDDLVGFLEERVALGTHELFTIAGCGPNGERELSHLASSRRVRVVPAFRRPELPALLAAHDAGLFTSRAEGWGLALNEMLESGLPVYATRAGGVDDLRGVLGSFVPDFPPPPGALPPPPPAPEVIERYDARFRWLAIAERYVEAVASAMS
jgi:glycosyltransferase involved in cell wall biosynthesis